MKDRAREPIILHCSYVTGQGNKRGSSDDVMLQSVVWCVKTTAVLDPFPLLTQRSNILTCRRLCPHAPTNSPRLKCCLLYEAEIKSGFYFLFTGESRPEGDALF
ncbi:hypothetical protein RRG08_041566 [Elysia crispata]|uniref:Uncharacterized protein n=1 Tax=Elysia crispata TaxID=231223 RepID=A0AAE0ZUH0_9GAST|nr:hypothetical protein RRG08_041566 [Elysia crispata]